MFKDQTILITGGTGSWGQYLTRKLLEQSPKEIRIFSRNEYAQVMMQRKFDDPRLRFIIGDVRDGRSVADACRGVDIVFHLAALKHVPICEMQPDEALKTNVMGMENVIRGSILHGVKKVIDVSTDKAVDPINFYGMTKAFGEKLTIRANEWSETTRFVCIRGGNVLGTNGSVVPFFRKRIEEGEDLPLTSQKMTRFFLTISEAIDLLLKAAQVAVGGEIFVMKMKSCRILDLIRVLEKRLAKNPVKVREIGVRPGEKLHEVLVSGYESEHTYHYDDHYYVIIPAPPQPRLVERYGHLPRVRFRQYDSSSVLVSLDEIEKMLERGGMLD